MTQSTGFSKHTEHSDDAFSAFCAAMLSIEGGPLLEGVAGPEQGVDAADDWGGRTSPPTWLLGGDRARGSSGGGAGG